MSCLPRPRDVERTTLGPDGLFARAERGTVYVETSTVGPDCIRRLAEVAKPAGIRIVDAPVSRGRLRDRNPEDPELVLWIGAPVDPFDLARPVLDVLGDRVVYCGGVGAGQITKLVNNLIAGALLGIVGEALALGVRAGANLDALSTALQHGTAQNRILDELFPATLFQGDFRPGLRLDLARKDLELAERLAAEHGLELASAGPVRELFDEAAARGWEDRTAHVVVRLIEERTGARLRSMTAQPLE